MGVLATVLGRMVQVQETAQNIRSDSKFKQDHKLPDIAAADALVLIDEVSKLEEDMHDSVF